MNDITLGEMKKAILNSGYLLEQRIESKLQKDEYLIDTNIAFKDVDSGKSRELDIEICKIMKANSRILHKYYIHMECENNKLPIVFFEKSDENFVNGIEYKYKMDPKGVKINNVKYSLHNGLKFSDFHHYNDTPFATQYCTFTRKSDKNPWMAYHSEVQHDTFTTLVKSIDQELKMPFNIPPRKGSVKLAFYYGVVVLQGSMYGFKIKGEKTNIREIKHVLFKKQVSSETICDDYLIDVITEDYLQEYLNKINNEMSMVGEFFEDK